MEIQPRGTPGGQAQTRQRSPTRAQELRQLFENSPYIFSLAARNTPFIKQKRTKWDVLLPDRSISIQYNSPPREQKQQKLIMGNEFEWVN